MCTVPLKWQSRSHGHACTQVRKIPGKCVHLGPENTHTHTHNFFLLIANSVHFTTFSDIFNVRREKYQRLHVKKNHTDQDRLTTKKNLK